MNSFVKNDGYAFLSMIAMVIGSLFNVIFDYIFIFVLHLNMLGAILATGFSPIVGLIILSKHYLSNKSHLKISKFNFNKLKKIIIYGIPSFLSEIASALLIILFNMIILKLKGNIGVAAYGIIVNIALVVNAMFNGIAQGVQPLLSKEYALNHSLNKLLNYSIKTVMIISIIIYFIIYIQNDLVISIFNNENNKVLALVSKKGTMIYFSSSLFVGLNTLFSMYFITILKPKISHMISLFRSILLLIPLVIILSIFLKIEGVWLSYPISELLIFIFVLISFKYTYNK